MDPTDQDIPPPTDADAPGNVIPIGDRRLHLANVSPTLDGLRALLEHPLGRECVTGSRAPIRYNVMRGVIEQDGEVRELNSFAVTCRIRAEQTVKYQDGKENWHPLRPNRQVMQEVIKYVALGNQFHPFEEYLLSLPAPDGSPIERLARDVLHLADPNEIELVRRWCTAVVARVLQPGCKMDTVLTLVDPQGGVGKSTFFCELVGAEYFSDSAVEIGTKDGYMVTQSCVVQEMAELDAIARRDASAVKAFITERAFTYRAPYAAETSRHLRRGVIVATTNDEDFLKADPAFQRRFWPVRITARIDVPAIGSLRDGVWAEAVLAYRRGDPWYLTDADTEVTAALVDTQSQLVELNPWVERIRPELTRIANTDIDDRSYAWLALEILKIDQTDMDRLKRPIGAAMLQLGWRLKTIRPKDGSQMCRRYCDRVTTIH